MKRQRKKKDDQLPLFRPQRCVFDASSLINIERNKRYMRHLRQRCNEVVVPEKVPEEVKKGGSGKPLYRYLEDFPEVVSRFSSDEEGTQYLLFRRQTEIHAGEAAAMAIAYCRNLPLVADERNVKKKAGNHGIKCIDYKEWVK